MWRIILLAVPAIASIVATASAQSGDAAAGRRVFSQCLACHTITEGGRNGVGPNLWGVVGRRAASIEGFRYSANMRERGEGGLTWTEDQLRVYVRNPKELVPRGTMSFPGLRNDTQLNDLIAYLAAQR
ncbi:cytochrome c family protein [Roseomonas terrae]|jgi:cytochrome c|uniref:Cytochrome c family protein n=1 Tax=Neoroseomonas terrae TaxID=424799 RepID=A0ABS5EGM8_9PROT|nr:cytochrome c family protein [Neoroseomonas terrae]MBR0650176.1 cytochrome c family protein [Neoroseomonas terrae]